MKYEPEHYSYKYYLVSTDAQAAAIRAEEKAPNVLRNILVAGTPEYQSQLLEMERLFDSGIVDIEVIDLLAGGLPEPATSIASSVAAAPEPAEAYKYVFYLVSSDADASAIRAEEKAPNILRNILVFCSPEYEAQYMDMESLLDSGIVDIEIIDLITNVEANSFGKTDTTFEDDWTVPGVWEYHFYLVDSDAEAARVLAVPDEENIARLVLVSGTPRFEEGQKQIRSMQGWGLAVSVFDMTD
jgi:hypothetical protein